MRKVAAIGMVFGLSIVAVSAARARQTKTQSSGGGKVLSLHAKGTFEPKVAQEGPDDKTEGSTLGLWSLAKVFHGDLQGTSKGRMLTTGTDVKGSAGYVAMERVTGTLQGRRGSFVLQHSSTMSHGVFQLTVTVVPDSGSGELKGIVGTMTIHIAADGKHSYDFDYTLPPK